MERIERGWAGHFICSDDCRFRRNTLLAHNGINVVVSTVGAMYPRNSKTMETVGDNRWYETMAFYATEDENGYIDADVETEFKFESEWGIWGEYESLPNNVGILANDMHEKVVSEVIDKMQDVKIVNKTDAEIEMNRLDIINAMEYKKIVIASFDIGNVTGVIVGVSFHDDPSKEYVLMQCSNEYVDSLVVNVPLLGVNLEEL